MKTKGEIYQVQRDMGGERWQGWYWH